jgi:hypothetical protein
VQSGGANIGTFSTTILQCPAFENDTRITGMPTIHIEARIGFTATSGHLFVEMLRVSDDMHLGHAVMDLRFHAGGKQGQSLTPGSTVVAKMQFFAIDAFIESGDGVKLVITQTGEDYLPSAVSLQSVMISLDESSIFSLSSSVRSCDDLFMPPMMSGSYSMCPEESE